MPVYKAPRRDRFNEQADKEIKMQKVDSKFKN